MVFLPREAARRVECEAALAAIVAAEGQTLLGWRDVPTDNAALGATAVRSEPVMRQVFIGRGRGLAGDPLAFERKLFVIRRLAEKQQHAARLRCTTLRYLNPGHKPCQLRGGH